MRLIIALLILIISCKQQGETLTQDQAIETSAPQSIAEEPYDTLVGDDFKNLFKYAELKSYNIKDSVNLRDWYKGLNRWDRRRILINGELKILELRGQPISYRKLNKKITRVITLNEGDSQLMVIAWALDDRLQVIDNVTLTSMGGDEGAGLFSFGKFINDTVFHVTVQQTKYDSEVIEQESNRCLIFHADGTIETIENCR